MTLGAAGSRAALRAAARRSADALLQGHATTAAARAVSASRLRILAYHDVPDPDRFRAQLKHLVRHYVPVSAEQVVAALAGTAGLPRRAAWVTFDDGHPDVLANAAPLLTSYGVPATMFVCPAVVDTSDPLWWQVVEAAGSLGVMPATGTVGTGLPAVRRWLKSSPDEERRAFVAACERSLRAAGHDRDRRQLTTQELRAWTSQGHTLGNHTWDHPVLPRCTPAEQVTQVDRAHTWLGDTLPGQPLLFAYPNGDWTATTELRLRHLGYSAAVLFDHSVARLTHGPLRLSRLRVSSTAPVRRFRAILSGAHSAAYACTGRR